MIDEDRTMQLFGYTSSELSSGSDRKVVAVCEECGKYRISFMKGYNDICASCSNIQRYKLPKPMYVPESDRFIDGTLIDRIETIKEYGYDPINLLPKANRPMISFCEGCGERRVTTNNAYKPLCQKCRFSTPETKKRMSIANSRPRGPMPEEQKKNISIANIGKKRPPLSDEHCKNISKGKKGRPTKLKGYRRSFEERKRLSAINQGIEYDEWTGFSDRHNRPHILPVERCICINEWFEGSNAHHITKSIVIYIPTELHSHIQHNIKTGLNMGEINIAAMQYVNSDILDF